MTRTESRITKWCARAPRHIDANHAGSAHQRQDHRGEDQPNGVIRGIDEAPQQAVRLCELKRGRVEENRDCIADSTTNPSTIPSLTVSVPVARTSKAVATTDTNDVSAGAM